MRSRSIIQTSAERAKQESSIPLLLGLISLFGIGYAIGSPLVSPFLPQVMERPFVKLHQEMNNGFDVPMRMVGLR